jgi:hypothetical protein
VVESRIFTHLDEYLAPHPCEQGDWIKRTEP